MFRARSPKSPVLRQAPSTLRSWLLVLITLTGACAAAPPAAQRTPARVAVWDLDDLSPGGTSGYDLGEALSGAIITELQTSGAYQVVARERLALALEELHLGSSALAEEETRLRLGRIVGAQWMVFGGYQVIAGSMRLDVRLVDVETGRILQAVQRTTSAGDVSAWLKAAGEAGAELCP